MFKVSVSVPGSLGVPAHIHRIPHDSGPINPTTQQLEAMARNTPPIQQVSISAVSQAASVVHPLPLVKEGII